MRWSSDSARPPPDEDPDAGLGRPRSGAARRVTAVRGFRAGRSGGRGRGDDRSRRGRRRRRGGRAQRCASTASPPTPSRSPGTGSRRRSRRSPIRCARRSRRAPPTSARWRRRRSASRHALTLAAGQRIEVAEVAVGSAAIYVPGGRAPYPSSVVMGVVPARVAGVGRVVVASPPEAATGEPAPAVLAAAAIAGADAVYAVGGAQAIAALAHGTGSIAAVDVIAGPGSPWVQEAKLQCSRRVGIDGYAGPSELVVIATEEVSREWIALDLCAQAEHGDDGMLVAIATDAAWLEGLAESIEAVQARRDDVGDSTLRADRGRGRRCRRRPDRGAGARARRGDHRRRARGRPPADDCGLRLRRRRPRRRRSATTRPGRTTCCRPAAPAGSPDRSARARSGGGSAGSRSTPRQRARSPRPSTRSPGPRDFPCTAGRRSPGRAAGTASERGNSAAWLPGRAPPRSSDARMRPTFSSRSNLDGGAVLAATGVGFLDHMLELLGRHGRLGLEVRAEGDLETGSHHTVEDVGIAFGQALDRALGDRAGITPLRPRRAADGRVAGALLDRHLRAALLPLPLRPAAGHDRRLRGRADRGVLPGGRDQREADPAPVESRTAPTPTT